MKLTVRTQASTSGFALPTILLVSTAMLAILMAAIGATAASRVALDSQYYNQLAQQAIESGIARATECLSNSGWTPQWSTVAANRDLRPHTNCTGATTAGNAYVLGDASGAKIRTKYSIEAPSGSGIGSALKVVGTTELVRAATPYNTWRSYEQVGYLRIEPQQAIGCPDGFISVPGNSQFGTSDFCVGKYEAKNVGGFAGSQAGGLPFTSISQVDAATAAIEACEGCHLITQAEWLTIAHNVMNVAGNWSGGAPGSGYIYSGHNDNAPAGSLVADDNDDNGYSGTGVASGNQRRTLRLSNGEVIWDFAGNVWEWTAGTVSGGQPGLNGFAWREWNTVSGTGSLSPNPFPSFGTPTASTWTTANGIGRLFSSSTEAGLRGILRGGYWNSGVSAGITTLNLNDAPTTSNNTLGFRLAR